MKRSISAALTSCCRRLGMSLACPTASSSNSNCTARIWVSEPASLCRELLVHPFDTISCGSASVLVRTVRSSSESPPSPFKFGEWSWQGPCLWAVVASCGSGGGRACVARAGQHCQMYLKASPEPPVVDVGRPCEISEPAESYCSLGPQLAGVRRDQRTPRVSPGRIVTKVTAGA